MDALTGWSLPENTASAAQFVARQKNLLPTVTFEDIITAVSRSFDVSGEAILLKDSGFDYTGPRQVAMWLVARLIDGGNLPSVGERFGCHPNNVRYAVRLINGDETGRHVSRKAFFGPRYGRLRSKAKQIQMALESKSSSSFMLAHITVQDIQSFVARQSDISVEDLLSSCSKFVTGLRYVAMWLAVELDGGSHERIAREFKRHPRIVSHAVRLIEGCETGRDGPREIFSSPYYDQLRRQAQRMKRSLQLQEKQMKHMARKAQRLHRDQQWHADIQHVRDIVARCYGISAHDICKHRQARQLARYVAMKKVEGASFLRVGKAFHCHHTTVMNTVNVIDGLRTWGKAKRIVFDSPARERLRAKARELESIYRADGTAIPAEINNPPRNERSTETVLLKNKHRIKKIAAHTARHCGVDVNQLKGIDTCDPNGPVWLAIQLTIYMARSLGHKRSGIAKIFHVKGLDGVAMIEGIEKDIKAEIATNKERKAEITHIIGQLADCRRIEPPVLPERAFIVSQHLAESRPR